MPKKRGPASKQTAAKKVSRKAAPLSGSRKPAVAAAAVPLADAAPSPPPAGIAKPLPPGTAGSEIAIPAAAFQQVLAAAAMQDNPGTQVWVQGRSELLVTTGKVQAFLNDGLVLIRIPVSCDQVPAATIQVPFATGAKNAPAGMVCATEERPRGPAAIVDVWGDALIAFAWRILLTAVTRAAARSGTDLDGAGLIPAALSATKDGIALLPMARHKFDRVPS